MLPSTPSRSQAPRHLACWRCTCSRRLAVSRLAPHAAAAHAQVPDTLLHDARESGFDSVEDGIAAVSRGEFVLVLDDQNRENEGDLITAADKVTPGKIAYMVEYTSGAHSFLA
jgi:hypothetical protein